MPVLTDTVLSFAPELNYAVNPITGATYQTFEFGGIGAVPIKSPAWVELKKYWNNDKYEPAGHIWGKQPVKEEWPIFVKNGVMLYYIMGKDTPVGAAPTVHTIAEDATTNVLPSFTAHIENNEATHASDLIREITGCRLTTLNLVWQSGGYLMYNLGINGSKLEDNITDGTVRLTTPPVLPATAVDSLYYLDGSATIQFNSQDVAEINSINITVNNGIKPTHEHQFIQANEIWPKHNDKMKKDYKIVLGVVVHDQDFYTAMKGKNLYQFDVKFVRKGVAADYIKVVATSCAVSIPEEPIPDSGELVSGNVTLDPLSMNFETSDTITDYASLSA